MQGSDGDGDTCSTPGSHHPANAQHMAANTSDLNQSGSELEQSNNNTVGVTGANPAPTAGGSKRKEKKKDASQAHGPNGAMDPHHNLYQHMKLELHQMDSQFGAHAKSVIQHPASSLSHQVTPLPLHAPVLVRLMSPCGGVQNAMMMGAQSYYQNPYASAANYGASAAALPSMYAPGE